MKKKIVILFLFSLVIPIHFIFGYYAPLSTGAFDFGGIYNPINVQIQPNFNTTQKIANTQKENYLKSTYGISSYSSCYSKYQSYCYGDITDTYTQTSCLGWIEYCLERQTMIPKREELMPLSGCISGQGYSLTTGISCDGTNRCDTGSQFNFDKTRCVVAPTVAVKTNDQICQDNYGTNSNWDGTKNDQGSLNCVCQTGFQFNQGQTLCVVITKATTSVTKKVQEIKTVLNTIKEDNSNIAKPDQVILNKAVETNTATETKPKPKGFWAKLKGLFGF